MTTVMSVPSTGTNFVLQLLRSHGIEVGAAHWKRNHDTPDGLIISPIRDPRAKWDTWVRANRGPPFTGLVDFEYSWSRLDACYLAHNDFYLLPVDSPDRDEYLARLSVRLGVELHTDWSRVNRTPGMEVTVIDLSNIYGLMVVRDVY